LVKTKRTYTRSCLKQPALRVAAVCLLLSGNPAHALSFADSLVQEDTSENWRESWQSSIEKSDYHAVAADDVWYRKPDYRVGIYTSLYTTHFNPKPEHNNNQKMLTLELYGNYFRPSPKQLEQDWLGLAKPLVGVASFKNSFDQDTIYAFLGIQQNLTHTRHFKTYVKLTAGFIHGYRGDYRDKIPFNTIGIAPAAVPMVGFQYQRFMGEMILFGASGVMFTAGFRF